MTRDTQPLMTRARLATAGLTLLTIVAAEKVMSSEYSQTPKKPEITAFIPNMDNFIGFNPRVALASALECFTNLTALKIHAPAEDPNRPVTGVTVAIWNETNPNSRLVLVADSDQSFNQDKSQYRGNSSVVGGREATFRGTATGERDCDNPDQSKCIVTPTGKKIKTTTMVGMQLNQDGSPLSGKISKVTVDCPSDIKCDWDAAWKDERTAVLPVPTPTPVVPVCPPDTKMVSENPIICEREVPVPVNTQPGQAPR